MSTRSGQFRGCQQPGEFYQIGSGEPGQGAAREGAAGVPPGGGYGVAAAERAGQRSGERGSGVGDPGETGGGRDRAADLATGGECEGEGDGNGLGGGDAVAVDVVHDLMLQQRYEREGTGRLSGEVPGQLEGMTGVPADLRGAGQLGEGGVDGGLGVRAAERARDGGGHG
ncbi:hypothetical protein GA0115259_104963, partial [Streptomyces sp. MnatMP-M17]